MYFHYAKFYSEFDLLRFSQIVVFLLVFHHASVAQQLEFPRQGYMERASFYAISFNNRYNNPFYHNPFTIPKKNIYKLNHVKKILVYNANGKLNYLFELDTSGNVIREGYLGHYFIVQGRQQIQGLDAVTSTSYYQDSMLVRTDTIFTKQMVYKNVDTVMGYTQPKIKVYKIGHLINEQNRYYNAKFYLKYTKNTNPWNSWYYNPATPQGAIHLYTKLSCNYDSLQLYFCSETCSAGGFYASTDNRKTYIDASKKLSKHPFYLENLRSKKNIYKTAGEDFNEPAEIQQVMSCGNSIYREQERLKEQCYYSSEIKYNHKGLYDTYYQSYFPRDTSATGREIMKRQQERNAEEVKNGLRAPFNSDIWYPRVAEPVKTLVYRIEYEYFQ